MIERRSTPRSRAWRSVFWLTSVAGIVAMAAAVGGLREAHLYRQRTGEGLGFALLGLSMFAAHGLLGSAAYAATRSASPAAGELRARSMVVGPIVAALVIGDVIFLWVEAHGDRCIGSCG